jgi:hypothetical protein
MTDIREEEKKEVARRENEVLEAAKEYAQANSRKVIERHVEKSEKQASFDIYHWKYSDCIQSFKAGVEWGVLHPQWIDGKKLQPNDMIPVLVRDIDGMMYACEYNSKYDEFLFSVNRKLHSVPGVTHWMRLPGFAFKAD